MRTNKYVEIVIIIFMLIMISLSLLLTLYYLTPSNYQLGNFESITNKIPSKKEKIQIDSLSNVKINSNNKILRIYSDLIDNQDQGEILIRIENKFKSESLYIKPSDTIKILTNDLIIVNPFAYPLTINVDSYEM